MQMLINEIIKDLNDVSEDKQISAVQHNKRAIGYIVNPSIKVQLAAVKFDGYALGFIQYPSEEVQLAAVEQQGYAIGYIRDPSEKVQLAAIGENQFAVQYIDNPTPRVLNICKSTIIKSILTSILHGNTFSSYESMLQLIKNTGWPEVAIIKKSLDANENK